MTDRPSAPLSGSLLARKGAASADGFALADIASRPPASYRWRMAAYSVTLALSVGVIAFVGAALLFGGPWAPADAPEHAAQAPPAPAASPATPSLSASSPAAIEPASGPDPATPPAPAAAPAAVAPEPVATAVVVPDSVPPAPVAVPQPPQPVAEPPPHPRRKPAVPARAVYRVQLYALASDAAVRREWRRLRRRHGTLLSGLKLTVAPKRSDSGGKTFYRMQLGALSSRTQARALCNKLRRKKMNCMVVR